MSSETIEAALGYIKRGWPIFPTRPDKTPLTQHGVQDATLDPAKVKAWWKQWPMANVAINLGASGMMVLDLDPGHSIEELEASVGPLPETQMWATTPRGGEHLFYALDEGETVPPSVAKLAAHVDVRSFNSYVLVWPSRTLDGEYEWQCDPAKVKPAYRSDLMAEKATATARVKSKERDEWIIEPDLPDNVALAVRWLKGDAKVAIEGAGGDATAYATAAYCKSLGISEYMASQLMWEHWNERCIPPWSPDEWEHLETKVRNAYAYNTSPPGNLTEAYRAEKLAQAFQPVAHTITSEDGTSAGQEIQAGRFRIVDWDGAGQSKPPSWLIEDAMPERGYAMLFGPPASYKSFIALDMALTVAMGPNWPQTSVWSSALEGEGTVLYCAGEGRAQMVNRMKAWSIVHNSGEALPGFFLADPVPHVGSPDELEVFIQGALAMNPEGYDLVVIDTVGRAMAGLNENAQEHASKFSNMVQQLQYGLLDAAVLAIHHSGHENSDRARGSSVFMADVDTMLKVERAENQEASTITMTKQKDAAEWQNPIMVEAKSVIVDATSETTSLAMIAPEPAKIAAVKTTDKASKSNKRRNQHTVNIEADAIIDESVEGLLKSNRLKAFSTRAVADYLNHKHGDLYSSEAIRKLVLRRLIADKTSATHRCFDPLGLRFRYVEKGS